MESLDLSVLADALNWRRAGRAVTLVTVVQTWGSAPRPPGSLLAVRDDGVVSGSVSGGCVEDDLIARTKARFRQVDGVALALEKPAMIAYGVTQEEAARFGLPCGGSLRLVQKGCALMAFQDQPSYAAAITAVLQPPIKQCALQVASQCEPFDQAAVQDHIQQILVNLRFV